MASSTFPGIRGPGPRVAAVLAGAALLFLAAGLLQLRRSDELFRETSALQHLLFARVAPLSDARALLRESEADLRALRHFPPEDRARVLAATVQELRDNRRALTAALGSYASLSPDSLGRGGDAELWAAVHGGGGAALRVQEKSAVARLRVALVRLDSLSARIVAGEQTPVGMIDYAVGEAAEPLAELVALNRHYAEQAEVHLADERRRLGREALALFGVVVALTGGAGLLLGRALAREARALADLSRCVAEGQPAPAAEGPSGGDLGTVAADLRRIAERVRARDEEVRALHAELAARAREMQEAARASAYKTWFIGHVSHEFRTPLSSIIGFTSFLHTADRNLPESRRSEYLGIILRNARHLLHVINDILNLSKVEAGTLEVTLGPLYTTEVIMGVVTALRPQAEERSIRLRFADHSHHLVRADAGRLRQVLFNLMENAIKYSPEGSEIDVHVTSDPRRIRIEIVDRGPGIPRELQPKLFKEFSRIQPRGAKVAGAGLGLALSRRLVELMDGEIGVVSAPGEGSTFWVELPAAGEILAAGEAEATLPGPAGRARVETVAVVDDDPDIRTYAFTILRHAGYPVVADDGEPGVGERLAAAAPGLILLDLNLRERTGGEALAELRATPGLARVPVVAFTAAARDELGPHGEIPGFQGYLAKPVEPDTLVETVDGLLATSTPEERKERVDPMHETSPAGPDDFLAPLRARFRSGLPDRLRALEEFLARGDADGFTREAHKLKGAAAGYGFIGLSEAAAAAEEALRGGAGLHGEGAVKELLERLRETTAQEPHFQSGT